MTDWVVGRSQRETALAITGTWLAFSLALCLALPQPPKPAYITLGALVGAALIVTGFSAASRWRPLPVRQAQQRMRLAVLSLFAGVGLGSVLLAVLVAFAGNEPFLRARFAGRLAEPAWRPWALAFESSILEEVTFRLFTMSIIAWLVVRLLKRPGIATAIAFVVSALFFALAHLPAWSLVTQTTPELIVAVLMLNGLGGLVFGWVFWRWGLPYAILCHLAGDVVIQTLGPRLLA